MERSGVTISMEEEDLQFILIEKMQIDPEWERVTDMEETWHFKKTQSSQI